MKDLFKSAAQRIIEKPKAFFYVFHKSAFSFGYYKEIFKTKTAFTLKYFFALTAIGAFFMAVSASFSVIPQMRGTVNDFITQLKEIYPDDLVISSQNNEWSINKEEPFIVKIQALEEAEGDFPDNFIAFDHDGTVEDLDNYDTLMLVNTKNILIKDASGLKTYPLKDIPDGEIKKDGFIVIVDNIQSFINVLTYLFILVGFIPLFIMLSLSWGLETLVLGGVLWVISMIMSTKLQFSNALRISVHTLSIPVLISIVLGLIRFEVPIVGWFFILHLVFGIVVLGEFGKEKAKG